MGKLYEEDEVVDIVLDVVEYVDEHDEQFKLDKSEEFVLPFGIEHKAAKVCEEYGFDKGELNNTSNLSTEGVLVQTELDDAVVIEILEFVENNNLSPKQAIGGMKLQANSSGGRPSKVDKWEKRIENGESLEDARKDMSDPTWYKLKKRVESEE